MDIITITGFPGSGKSTIAKRLAYDLGYSYISAGDFFREVAKERGISVDEANRVAEHEVRLDHETDGRIKALATRQKLIIDSRLGFFWIPDSFKVCLTLPPEITAERIFTHVSGGGRVSESAQTIREAYEAVKQRHASERMRFRKLYDVDIDDREPFDCVLDMADISFDEAVRAIHSAYDAWRAKRSAL